MLAQVPIVAGSSSATPAIRPGPSRRKKRRTRPRSPETAISRAPMGVDLGEGACAPASFLGLLSRGMDGLDRARWFPGSCLQNRGPRLRGARDNTRRGHKRDDSYALAVKPAVSRRRWLSTGLRGRQRCLPKWAAPRLNAPGPSCSLILSETASTRLCFSRSSRSNSSPWTILKSSKPLTPMPSKRTGR